MVEFIIFAVMALTVLLVCTLLASVFGLVLWMVFLPFRIMGWILQAFALLLMLPIIAVVGLFGFAVVGAGVLMFLLPVIPFVLIALGAWWLVRRKPASTASVTG